MTIFKPLIWGTSESCLCYETATLTAVIKSSVD